MSGSAELEEWLTRVTPDRVKDTQAYLDFLEAEDIELTEEIEDDPRAWVLANAKDAFEDWLSNEYDFFERYEVELPTPYSEIMYSPSSWYLHFTFHDFMQFNDGVRRQYLGNSGAEKQRAVKCPDNLYLPPEEQRWVHAFPVFQENDNSIDTYALNSGLNYGTGALLFQSDEVVYAKHTGHEEWHALVLCCSEKNAVRLSNLTHETIEEKWMSGGKEYTSYRDTFAGTAHLAVGDVEFTDIRELVDKLEEPQSALGGFGRITRKIGRWHRLARKY